MRFQEATSSKSSVLSDRFYAKRAAELTDELLWQVCSKQKGYVPGSADWQWLEEVFQMLLDIKGYAMPGIPEDERREYHTLTEYRGRFRAID